MLWKNPETEEWEKLAGFVLKKLGITRIREQIRKLKTIRYKKRKVDIQKLTGTSTYKITFDLIIRDENNPIDVGPFTIEIPAEAMYLAKMKLVQHLQNSIDIQVHDFVVDNEKFTINEN